LANNAKVRYGSTLAVAVFVLQVYWVIQATFVLTTHSQQKVAAEALACIVTNVVAIKDAVCQVFGKAATAALAAQIHMKAVHLSMNMDTWHSACFHTVYDATQITVLDQLQFPHVKWTGGTLLISAVLAHQALCLTKPILNVHVFQRSTASVL
jgi:hypothetical protein